MIQMNLFTKQKQTHRLQKHAEAQLLIVIKGKRYGGWINWKFGVNIYTLLLLLLLLLSRFSRVRLCATPETAAHQAPPSLGFSRQEHWSGLPFPFPMHESEKRKVKVKSLSRVRLLATPWTAAYPALPSMGFARQEHWSRVPFPSPMHESEKSK